MLMMVTYIVNIGARLERLIIAAILIKQLAWSSRLLQKSFGKIDGTQCSLMTGPLKVSMVAMKTEICLVVRYMILAIIWTPNI